MDKRIYATLTQSWIWLDTAHWNCLNYCSSHKSIAVCSATWLPWVPLTALLCKTPPHGVNRVNALSLGVVSLCFKRLSLSSIKNEPSRGSRLSKIQGVMRKHCLWLLIAQASQIASTRDAGRVKGQTVTSLAFCLCGCIQTCVNTRCVLITTKDPAGTGRWTWILDTSVIRRVIIGSITLWFSSSIGRFLKCNPFFYFAAVFQIALTRVTLSYCKSALVELTVDPKGTMVIPDTDTSGLRSEV